MRVWIAVPLLIFVALPSTGNAQKYDPQKDQKNASQISPSSINVTVSQPASDPQREKPDDHPRNPYEWFWPPVWSNWVLAAIAGITAFFAIRNLRAIEAQVDEMRKTGEQTDKLLRENIAQSRSMADSVKEAARSASAMEGVAKSLETTATASLQAADTSRQMLADLKQQFRAWVNVSIGAGASQQRTENRKFAATIMLNNTGLTPAINVRYRISVAILPVPLPANFDFPMPQQDLRCATVAAHTSTPIAMGVDDFVPDEEVENVKNGNSRGLYAWGKVLYDDVLGGKNHPNQFCLRVIWLSEDSVTALEIPEHSRAE